MKTAKLVIGILSIVLCMVVIFQSCAAGIGNTLSENGESSGTAGFFLAICMLTAGIVGIATRKGKAGAYAAGGIYAIGGIMGICNYGSFADLMIWSVLCFIFAAVFILGTLLAKPKAPRE